MDLKNIETLLQQVQIKLDHSNELSKLKGENFNIFSLLNMEANENKTHSRFLAELLSPKGSHGLGYDLLSWFINLLPSCFDGNSSLPAKFFDVESATVTIEKHIGRRDDVNKTGGRIDIAIIDKNGYSILIENKIYAGDQYTQIERYCNFNKSKCLVFYLTLFGDEPSKESRGSILQSGTDYYNISYKHEITDWLEQSIKEAADFPVLRETIRQYLTLIKKLTGQLTHHQMDNELKKIILNNLESADVISKNYIEAKEELLSRLRVNLKMKLAEKGITEKYDIAELGKIGEKNSKLWLFNKEVDSSVKIYFGIEPFSGYGVSRNDLFIGIIDIDNNHHDIFLNDEGGLDIVGWWRGLKFLSFEGSNISLSNIKLLKELSNEEKMEKLINQLADQTLDYILEHEETLIRICSKAKSVNI